MTAPRYEGAYPDVSELAEVMGALMRLKAICMLFAAIYEAGERDPNRRESVELEEAAINYGRLCIEHEPKYGPVREAKAG